MDLSVDQAAVAAAKIGGDIVAKTLDTLNSDQFSVSSSKRGSGSDRISDSYHLNKSVLSSAYQPKGAVISAKG